MPSVYKLTGTEQTFTTGNTFSSSNSTQISGWNIVRVVNIGSAAKILSVNSTPASNITILPLTEVIIEKAANTLITAIDANLLGTSIAWKNN